MRARFVPLLILGFVFAPLAIAHDEHDATGIQVETLTQSTVSWDGTPLETYPSGQPEVTILKITVPPKTRLGQHYHTVINAGVLLSGNLKVVTAEGKVLHLGAGDPIIEVVDKWHYGENITDTPAQIIVFYAGILGQSVTVKKTDLKPCSTLAGATL